MNSAPWLILRRVGAVLPLPDVAVVTIHMLRGDSGGRSFYIRPREDLAVAHMAASSLSQLYTDAASASNPMGWPDVGQEAPPPPTSPRFYFWLTHADLPSAVHSLGRLKSRKSVSSPAPTLQLILKP